MSTCRGHSHGVCNPYRVWNLSLQANVPGSVHRHKLPTAHRVISKPILGGLHHEYSLETEAA